MWGAALVAAFISGPRPAVRPPAASLAPVPQIVLKIDPSDDSIPINHLMREKSWTVAQAGPLFTRLVLTNYYRDRVTATDVADYPAVKLKHLPKIP